MTDYIDLIAERDEWERRCRLAVDALDHIASGRSNLPKTQAMKAIYEIGHLPPGDTPIIRAARIEIRTGRDP